MTSKGNIFVTGGAGYVGSHTVLELLNAGYAVVVMDNYHNAHPDKEGKMPESLRRVQELTGKVVTFYKADLKDQTSIDEIFKKASHHFDCVIHFAALKAVGESWQIPLDYYRTNLGGTVNLLDVMRSHGVKRIIFSSSCTVYGVPKYLPIDEDHPTGQSCTNPLRAHKGWSIVLLRYFNPVGAHESGYIGEDPQGIPNNLMPYVSQVAIGRRSELSVFGNDFKTRDGTGVRDYVHVVDLAKGHVATLDKVMAGKIQGCKPFNLGTGQGSSVLEVIAAFEKASGMKIPYKIVDRRQGDVDELYAIPNLAEKELGWKAEKSLYDMCMSKYKRRLIGILDLPKQVAVVVPQV
ncbi:hypothetical protein HPB51_017217 [Rhipicephalus microplus]|uniref:UDP-glucose 4-epimerase n=1 Tax=Rhipicephalus microplus TaxID=6941 RepID=A0A9J6EBJ7_RHIMP|nr:hypothetical protein HPB51_017217 [Rhipicephalus microplus]